MSNPVELIGQLTDGTADQAVVQEELENLGPPPAEHHSAIAEYLASGTPDQTYWAATLLGRNPTAISCYQDELTRVVCSAASSLASRERAAWALGQFAGLSATNINLLRSVDVSRSPRLARLIEAVFDQPGRHSAGV